MRPFSINALTSGGVITNYHCVSRCGHCLYNCGPHRRRDYLEETLAEKIFATITRLGCSAVHIGGGEPLLDPSKLIKIVKIARQCGVAIDYVETNSAWFVDAARADAVLTNLLNAGVHSLLISISPFHNAFVPFIRVKEVIAACRRQGLNTIPWVNGFVRDLDRLDPHRPHAMQTFLTTYGPDYLERIPDRYWIHMGGRALKTFRGTYPSRSIDAILADSPRSCARALMDTSHFHLDLEGHYIPGLCAGLAIAMTDLGAPLPVGKYPLLDCLVTTGIRGLLELAADTYGFQPQRHQFLNHCDLCTEIRTFLIATAPGPFPELAPEGFYTELLPDERSV